MTTKIEFAKKGASPEEAAEATRRQIDEDLGVLGVDSVDMLMLRDSLSCDVTAAQWAVLEKAKAAGRARSLGVINFCEGSLKCLLRTAKEKPSVNYFQQHIGMGPDPKGLRSFGESKGIRTFAYGALGEPGPSDELLASPVLKRIGAAHGGKLPEEVALRWALQGGAAVSIRPTADFGLGRSACSRGVGRLRRRPRAPRRRARLGADTRRDGGARRVDVASLEPHTLSRRRGAPTRSLQESPSVPAEPRKRGTAFSNQNFAIRRRYTCTLR